MKILFVSTEADPFAKSGGLGDVAGSLPRQLNSLKMDARVVLPLYKSIKRRFSGKLEFLCDNTVNISDVMHIMDTMTIVNALPSFRKPFLIF